MQQDTIIKPVRARGGRPSKRDMILESAEELVHSKGAAHLTFDALTEITGISKGGLLYHFESKDALISAMLERYVEQRMKLKAEIQGEATGVDAEINAMIRAELAHNKRGKLGVDSAILAAVASNPELTEIVQPRQQELFRLLDQCGVGPIQARVAWYAVIGHRLARQFGMNHGEEDNDEALTRYLLKLITPES
ncbi:MULTISPECIES: TetR/AcrR family transcriptional regulator [Gammaproteobacteria]|uniref:TetR/AcrR family transcriptional regulator n=1 Tax=Gammaproteobacteria TaxID=1236 RepID=UPI000DCF7BCA|nr:TetR/AcrR family transcriptional regulator [Aliidiomarina sp. B3213]RTE86347.1 TetR/AcrR family transcriptional regulator [Aliidiomarina sp. B3213]TCZ91697.1 TetR/AcrR family transcriptional regulator [Lysobacter sp. N42]